MKTWNWRDFESHFKNNEKNTCDRVIVREEKYSKYKKMRIRCPHCKRRMIAKVIVCSIGCCVEYIVPPHKTTKRTKWKSIIHD